MTRPGVWRDEAHDFNDLLARVKRIELAMSSSHVASLDAALPSTPSDGQDFYYSLPDGGQWHFRFNERTGLWDFVGGPPIVSIPANDSWSGRSFSTYQTLTNEGSTNAPSLTVPFAGSYLASFGGVGWSDVNGTTVSLGLSVNGNTPSTNADVVAVVAAANQNIPMTRAVPAITLAANDVLTLRGKGSGSGWGFYSRHNIVLTPTDVFL